MFSRDRVVSLLLSNGFTGRGGRSLSASAWRIVRKLQYIHSKRLRYVTSSWLHSTGAMWPSDSAVTNFLVENKVLTYEFCGREKRYRLL